MKVRLLKKIRRKAKRNVSLYQLSCNTYSVHSPIYILPFLITSDQIPIKELREYRYEYMSYLISKYIQKRRTFKPRKLNL